MSRVFVSYANKDLALASEVRQWLVDDSHAVFLDQDLRDGIAVGEEWKPRLHERLRWANAVVCVVTSAYLASEWCTAEVKIARSWGKLLLPVRAEPGVVHALLTSIQHTDLTRDRDVARIALVEALRRVDSTGDPGWPDDRSPFPGLHPFDVDWHQVFFGRVREIDHLAGLLRSTAERAESAVMLVVGPSGCGKSSLVRAGLLPVMTGEPGWWTLPPIVPGADPVAALARGLVAASQQLNLGWTMDHVGSRLGEHGLTGLSDELLSATPGGSHRHLLVVVDQFDELLTHSTPDKRAQFAELLRSVLTGSVHLVATLRPESIDQLLCEPELAGLPTQIYTVQPLRREALRTAIEEPARLAGIDVDEFLVAQLIDDTDGGEALPLLAFTLAQLADGVGRGGQLSNARYEELGGVRGALTREADAALADALAVSGRSRNKVIEGLLRLVTVDEQGRPTRWRVGRDELPDVVVHELNVFVARRLLSTDTDNGRVVIGVAHEAFLTAWPPLARAITEAGPALRACRAVEHAAAEWDENRRPSYRLWSGGQLTATIADTGARIHAGAWPADAPPQRVPSRWLPWRHGVLITDHVGLSPMAHDFLHASIRRDRLRRRRAVTVLSVLLVLALAAAGIAVIQQRDAKQQQRAAEKQQRVATARQLVAQAENTRETDPRTALQLGVAAQHIHPDGETYSSLVNTLTTTRYAKTLTGHAGTAHTGSVQVAFSADGRTLATAGSTDRTVILWDLTDPSRPRRLGQSLAGHNDPVVNIAFSRSGTILATVGGTDSTVILWDLTDRVHPRRLGQPLTDHPNHVSSVAFAPNGNTLATGSANGTAILWDLKDPTQPHRLGERLVDSYGPVAFSPDGKILATGKNLWNVTDPARPHRIGQPLTGDNGPISSVVFSSDGKILATTGSNGAMILRDLTDPAQPRRLGQPLAGDPSWIFSIAFSPDNKILATSGTDGTAILWGLTDSAQPRPLGKPLTGHMGTAGSVAFSSDGHTVATGGVDGTAILWDLTGPAQPRPFGQPLAGDPDWIYSVEFFPDGHILATGEILWDVTDRAQPRRLGRRLDSGNGLISSVASSPDGKILAIGDILWDVTDPLRPRRLGQPFSDPSHEMRSKTFSPSRELLATTMATTGSTDYTVILWDLTDPAQPRRLGQPLAAHGGGVYSVAFSPDGSTLATGSIDGSTALWSLTDPAQPRRLGQPLTGHGGGVYSVAFSPDGSTLATASHDGTVVLWGLTDPTRPRRLGQPLAGHGGEVYSLAFSPDGRTLATGSVSGTAILWDLTDLTRPRRLGQPLPGLVTAVYSLAFSPDGNTLATTGSAGLAVILWDLTALNDLRNHAVERACSIVEQGLDPEKWARYMPGLPHQDTCLS